MTDKLIPQSDAASMLAMLSHLSRSSKTVDNFADELAESRLKLLDALGDAGNPAISGPQPEDFTDMTADGPKKGGVDG